MGRRNRKCYLCDESYEYCPTCSQDRTKPSWMAEFHSENCKDIFDICTRFNMQLLTKDEAKLAVEKYDLSNKLKFRPSVQSTLSTILMVNEVIFENEESSIIEEEPIIAIVDAKIEEITEDEVIVEVTPRKKAKKSHVVVLEEKK